MTTTATTVTASINVPGNIRVAVIHVNTPPTSYTTGGVAIPLPAGFRRIKYGIAIPRYKTTNHVPVFDAATQKLSYFTSNGAAAAALAEFTSTGDVSAFPVDILAFDWDEDAPVAIAGA